MKHLLNNLSEEEKNRIREQHEGGMRVNTDRFKTLIESKLGNAKPLLSEKFSKEQMDKIIQMDAEFNNDPTYVEYEKKYALKKLKNMLSASMGVDTSEIPDEMAEMMIGLAGEAAKQRITPEIVYTHKDSVIKTVSDIMEIAMEDNQTELCDKLQTFIDLLKEI